MIVSRLAGAEPGELLWCAAEGKASGYGMTAEEARAELAHVLEQARQSNPKDQEPLCENCNSNPSNPVSCPPFL